MSVFGSIVSAIFGSKHAASVTAAAGLGASSIRRLGERYFGALSINGHSGRRFSTIRWHVNRFGGRCKADLES